MRFAHLVRTWEENARTDPLWSILALPGKTWDAEEFFETGERDVAELMAYLGTKGLPLRHVRALDFGCGVGRLTQALANSFAGVDGVDVSARMIELARARDRSGGRCRFSVNPRPDLRLFADGAFDLVVSLLVLQHIPPPFSEAYVAEFGRVAAPGGALLFQAPHERRVPEGAPPWRRRLGRLIRRGGVRLEMFALPQERVRRALERAGCELLEVRPDVWAGHDWTSYTYLAQRK